MNIFYLDTNVVKCAQAHCDRHVNKMILESAQLIASAIHITSPESAKDISNLYKVTHKNHPDSVWVRSSINHYLYVLDLMEALNEEAQYRYEHSRVHESLAKVWSWPTPKLPNNSWSDPPRCVHDDFKNILDTVSAYRAYYLRDKRSIVQYTKRSPPDWWVS